MAHFRGTVQGNRGLASRLSTAASGLTVTADSWTSGVKIHASVDGHTSGGFSPSGRDVFQVVQTGGSNGGRERELLRIVGTVNPVALVDCGGFQLSLDRLIEIANEKYPAENFSRRELSDSKLDSERN